MFQFRTIKVIKKSFFFIYLLFISTLSLWPSDGLPDVILFPYADKVIHTGMYAGFTFLMLWAWSDKLIRKKQILPLIMVILWGFFMELLQGYSHFGREFDLTDELANTLGFVPGWIGWRVFKKRISE